MLNIKNPLRCLVRCFKGEICTTLNYYFLLLDKDGDGTIDPSEIAIVMRSLGQQITEKDMKEIIAVLDADGNGSIGFDEFLDMMSMLKDPEDEMLKAFQVFDADGSGNITAQELRTTMGKLGVKLTDDEVDDMINEADTDGDGQISYEEFSNMMKLCL